MTAYENILDALRSHGAVVNANGQQTAMAQCPAHNDRNPSLSISVRRDGDGAVLNCHAGCDMADVLKALNLTMADLFDDRDGWRDVFAQRITYPYPGGRRVHRKPDKQFPQDGNKDDCSLFHSDRIGGAETVYVVEGEKDVLAVEKVGGVAVSSAMGAGKAHLADWTPLHGRHVVIVADKDEPGRKHAAQVAGLLDGLAASVRTVEAAVGKDVSDHIAAGLTLDELVPVQEPSLLDQRSVNGTWLDEQQFPELEYHVEAIIPEGLGLLVAPPKKGKSFLVADVALAVARGGYALGAIKVVERPVLYLALEDGWRRLQNRFRRIIDYEGIPEGVTLIIKATALEAPVIIAEFLARYADDKPLVIVDTLGKIKPQKRSGEDSYLTDYKILSGLKTLTDDVPGSTVLLVHHTRKAESADFIDSISGTQGIAGAVDFVLALDRKRLANDAILSVTGRDVIEAEYGLIADEGILWRLDGQNLNQARQAVERRRATARMGDRSMDVYDFVGASPDAVTAVAVASKLDDVDADTAGKYLRRLADKGYITKVGRGQYLKASVSEVSEVDNAAGQGLKISDTPTVSEVSETSGRGPMSESETVSDTKDTSDGSDTKDTSDTDRSGASTRFDAAPPCFHCDRPVTSKTRDDQGRYVHLACQHEQRPMYGTAAT